MCVCVWGGGRERERTASRGSSTYWGPQPVTNDELETTEMSIVDLKSCVRVRSAGGRSDGVRSCVTDRTERAVSCYQIENKGSVLCVPTYRRSMCGSDNNEVNEFRLMTTHAYPINCKTLDIENRCMHMAIDC